MKGVHCYEYQVGTTSRRVFIARSHTDEYNLKIMLFSSIKLQYAPVDKQNTWHNKTHQLLGGLKLEKLLH